MVMKQLSGIDASFLYMETPETPMHVAGLTLYEPPKGLGGTFHAHFTRFFESRMHLIPIFSKRLARSIFELDHPGWVDAKSVDLDYHIQPLKLPAPGTFAQLEQAVGELHGVPLDRSRPLWQFHIIEGLEDGRVALYSKVHHAAVDGGAGMVITQALYDFTETPRDIGPPPPKTEPERKPSVPERAILGVHDLISNVILQQINALHAGAQMLASVATMIAPPKAERAVEGEKKKGGGPRIQSIPSVMAPKTPFNVTITAQRSFAARSLPLSDAKAIARATGTKINDIVMAACSGALRNYLASKKKLPKQPLIAFVPISLRMPGDTEIKNQVFGMNCELATDLADPLDRLFSIRRTSNTSKTFAGVVKDAAPTDFTLLGAPMLLPGLMQLFGRFKLAEIAPQAVNCVISNVPGPQVPLYCAGARVLELYPVSIPVHGIALNITVQSYDGHLDFGVTADAKAVPDVGALADKFAGAMAELRTAAEAYAVKKAAKDAARATEKAKA